MDGTCRILVIILNLLIISFNTKAYVSQSGGIITTSNKSQWENNEEIKLFREYLRIPTMHPAIDYSEFIQKLNFISEFFNKSIFRTSCGIFRTTSGKFESSRFNSLPNG